MKNLLFFVISLIIILIGCSDTINNPEINEPIFPFADTLECNITSGIKMKLKNISDIYDIDNSLTCQIVLSNLSDTSAFSVYFPIWPAYSFTVYDKMMEGISGGPEAVSLTSVRYNLNIGESYTYDIWWSKKTNSKVKYGIDFPAFVGNYLLVFELVGNLNLYNKYLYKWIRIKESGEQLIFKFQNSYEQSDIAIFDLAMRNRFPIAVDYHLKDKAEVKLFIIENVNQDTVFSKVIPLPDLSFRVPSLSDTLLFSYRLDKTEPQFQNLSGLYDVKAVIQFVEKEISLMSKVYFYN